ncbi:MAG: glycosyltransferase [Candidatus Acidiferrales bacterium]
MPRLALSMIVKNAAATIEECLISVRGVVDEIVVADTGSTDETIEIARRAGARVISIAWEDDFSRARNLSLAETTADWVLSLDADERLDPGASNELPGVLDGTNFWGFQTPIRNYVRDPAMKIWDRAARPNDGSYLPARAFPAYIEHENVRLFRRHPDIYFTGRVHETVGWRIRETGRTLGAVRTPIHHFGMAWESSEARFQKIVFYRELGRKKLEETPENAQAHFEFGLVEMENFGEVGKALPSFERACQLDASLGAAWFFAGACHFQLGNHARALYFLQHAEDVGHLTPGVAELLGDTNYKLGNYETAGNCYRRGLKRLPSSAFLESKLGLAEARTGNSRSGLRRLRHALTLEASNPDLHDRLISVEVWLGHLEQAGEAAERKLGAVAAGPNDYLRAASIRAEAKKWEHAKEILQRGVTLFPEAELLRISLSKIELLSNTSHEITTH